MITRIEVSGFKSLRDVRLDLSPLTALVGPNGTGKSNLLDALLLLSLLAQKPLVEALKSGRGRIRDQFSRNRDGVAQKIEMAVELLAPMVGESEGSGAAARFRYRTGIVRAARSNGLETVAIAGEGLSSIAPEADDWMKAHLHLQGHVEEMHPTTLSRGMDADPKSIDLQEEDIHGSLRSGRQQSWLLQANDDGARRFMGMHDYVHDARAALRAIHFLHLEPAKLRLASEPAAEITLASDGSNLPTALAALDGETRAQIRADLADLVSGIRSFEVTAESDLLHLEVELIDGSRVPARSLSDGTLRLFGILTALRSAKPGSVLLLEEPENGVYPGRLRALVQKFLQVTQRTDVIPPQIILTSHAPALVAALRDQLESLVLVDVIRSTDGLRATRLRPVDPEGSKDRGATSVSPREVERLLESVTLREEA